MAGILPWSLMSMNESAKANSKQEGKCPLNCPTFLEAKRVSQQIEKAKKDYKKIKNKSELDYISCYEIIKPLVTIKE